MSLPKKPTSTTIETSADLESVYTNLVRISHSPADFVMDFAHLLPGGEVATVKARMLMTPLTAKLLLNALTENIARYETAFGIIDKPLSSSALGEITYSPPTNSRSPLTPPK